MKLKLTIMINDTSLDRIVEVGNKFSGWSIEEIRDHPMVCDAIDDFIAEYVWTHVDIVE